MARARTLHLVDLENLLGDERCSELGSFALVRYLELARWASGDQVIVVAHPELIRQVGFDPPVPCNFHATRGHDAADAMLLALAPVELIARRFDRLVIGSGDGIFVSRARAVRERDVPVLVVARVGGVAERFRRWAFPVLAFDFGAGESAAEFARSVAAAA